MADVQAGRVDTARASWWGFDPVDATRSLQAALDSAAKTIVIEEMGRPWVVTTIQLPSHKEIVLQPGVVIEAKRGEFLEKGACLLVARGRQQLRLRGDGATLRMHKRDYHQPPYELAEWRHALSIRGCEDVVIEGLTLQQSGGDGIYLGTGSGGATNRNITIRKVVCDGNNRQGISVITAEHLLIEDCVFRNTRGTAPQAGIDFEPNHPDERLVDCVLRGCRSESNAGHAYHIYLGHMHEESTPVSIRFEDCTSKACGRFSTYVGVANRNGRRTVRGTIEYIECCFDADQGAGLYIRGNEAEGCHVRFERCKIIRRDEPDGQPAAITIEAPRRLDIDVGNIVIDGCVIRDSIARRPIALIASPLTRIRKISGRLSYESPEGKRSYGLDSEQLAEWFPRQARVDRIPRWPFDWRQAGPASATAAAERGLPPFRLRQQASLLVWGQATRRVELVAKEETVGRGTPAAGVMTITMPSGESMILRPTVTADQLVYAWTPQTTGPALLKWQGDTRVTFRAVRCTEPSAILGQSLGVNLFRPVGALYCLAPPGSERFAVQVAGAGSAETVKATVRDASQRVVDQEDNIAAPHVFYLERADAEPAEVWSVTFEPASQGVLEDVSLQTLGVPPVFGVTNQNVFGPRHDATE
jgi:hypothetical protein